MKISALSYDVLLEIYNLSKDDYSNSAYISPKDLGIKLNVSREFIYKCIAYLFDKQLVKGDAGYSDNINNKLRITIKASGIDLIEGVK